MSDPANENLSVTACATCVLSKCEFDGLCVVSMTRDGCIFGN